MIITKKYWYMLLILMCGYTQQYYAGNAMVVRKETREDGKVVNVIEKNEKQRIKCFRCRRYDDYDKNPCWQPCEKKRWWDIHDDCKTKKCTSYIMNSSQDVCFRRNQNGLLPLSIAIFRGKNEAEREDSCIIVNLITEKVGKDVFNMVMLRDHAGCSVWMHSIYIGNVEIIKIILSAVQKQCDDPEAVWKLLTTDYSGGHGGCRYTPLMVAVKQKNILLIELLKQLAGKRFNEYVQIERQPCKKTMRDKKTAIDFLQDSEIIKLLLVEDYNEYESDEYLFINI